ncbi:glycine betaine ABC transporter substrate-binding protein [Limisalsivibrio acetivorans]|uniref:glycine betaine ABC transporter substrate-binding protein n=1 Tax=Limisalsivibrio acetivorans TaxID=1304888 RepID=UPI0003B5EC30|nr:glycine betaine ABC transporter substrate-binding protein [Limisalsivibrio acetivorans]
MIKNIITTTLLALLLMTGVVQARETVKIAYVDWSSSVASSYVVKAVLEEKMGIPCRLIEMPADEMWKSVAQGRVDAILSAWLPDTHDQYYAKYGEDVDNLGANLEGTRIGLVIPQVPEGRYTSGTGIRNRPFMDIDSIEDIQDNRNRLSGRIVGIDPEAGIMIKTREAMLEYGLENFHLADVSEQNMVRELERSIKAKKWIVITGWEPHWIFARWGLKFLEDPKDVYGNGGHIATLARKGLKEEMPDVYRFLDGFQWEKKDMEQVMLWIHQDKGNFPYEKAVRWINTHQRQVDSWIK